ncbi:MAG: 30S ribosomal protein S8e [Desulfurococcales archaeon]|nr:30S ribosomal protein S8e [Desulfurococcales archaeon]
MSVYQGKDFRKITGGRRRPHRKKRKYELGRFPTLTMLSNSERITVQRVRGGDVKIRVKKTAYANVTDPSEGITKRVKILKVVRTPANREYARRGIITKGTLIETELGLAKVTSRPGQDGVVNAVLTKPAEGE